MGQAVDVSRAGFYRYRNEPESEEGDIELRDQIQKIALEMPAYGRRRITADVSFLLVTLGRAPASRC
jgi:hypothetical protein